MIFDELGLPKDTGASDLQDSSRLAGIMRTFNWPKNVPIEKYLIDDNSVLRYCRHPLEYKYDFSRDQALCLMTGLFFAGDKDLVKLEYVDGKDVFFPSHRGHVKRCQGNKANWFEDLWLKTEILYSAKFTPMNEPNQLLCMCAVAGPEYLKMYTKHNKMWRAAILEYWDSWRGERELAHAMITQIEWVISG